MLPSVARLATLSLSLSLSLADRDGEEGGFKVNSICFSQISCEFMLQRRRREATRGLSMVIKRASGRDSCINRASTSTASIRSRSVVQSLGLK